ncbi:MAG: copper chaperone PCu(A)C [Sphingomonas sp.]
MRRLPLIALAAASVASCGQPREIFVDHGYVRLSAVSGNPAVAYFTLHGGGEATMLLSVTSPTTIKTELHESMAKGGMSSMAPIKDVALPPKADIAFQPGGKHVMLFNVNPGVKPGDTMPLIFTFANNLRIQYDAPVIAAGDPAPKG